MILNKTKQKLNPFFIQTGKFGKLKDTSYKRDWTETSLIEGIGVKKTTNENFNYARLNWLRFTILLFVGLIIIRATTLQIVKGDHYYALAKGNRTRIERIEPKRGIIYDKNYKPLVVNVANFLLYFIPSSLPQSETEKNNILITISEIVDKLKLYEIRKILQSVDKNSLEYYNPLFITDNIPYEQAINLYLKTENWPGVILTNRTKRKYILPDNIIFNNSTSSPLLEEDILEKTHKINDLDDKKTEKNTNRIKSLSHILGYTGKINKKELDKFGKEYSPIDYVGKTGIEYFWEQELKGINGKKQIEVDAIGNQKKVVNEIPPIDGNNIIISINIELQQKIEEIVTKYLNELELTRSSIIILNPNNGEILALVSLPAYDNNVFARGISLKEYNDLLNHPDKPLFNRAISGEFPTGSTIKPVMVAAALEEHIVGEYTSFRSTGGVEIGSWYYPDWKEGGHGLVDARKALAESVNTYFYYIGGGFEDFKGLGIKRITQYSRLFGLGSQTGIDLTGDASGFLPSKEWKKKVKGERWYIGDTYHVSIGQGDVLATPLQVAMFTSVFANGGTLYRPHIATKIVSSDGKEVKNIDVTPIRSNFMDSYNIIVARQGLRRAVTSGSARKLYSLPVTSAGKTGTAQWSTKKEPHAWFTGFAPYRRPEIVITIIIEEGSDGSKIAVQIAKEILAWYFK